MTIVVALGMVSERLEKRLDGWLVGFYVISTFVGYLTPNPFLDKSSVLFQTIQFSMCTQLNSQKTFIFQAIQFRLTIQTIQFSISIDFL